MFSQMNHEARWNPLTRNNRDAAAELVREDHKAKVGDVVVVELSRVKEAVMPALSPVHPEYDASRIDMTPTNAQSVTINKSIFNPTATGTLIVRPIFRC